MPAHAQDASLEKRVQKLHAQAGGESCVQGDGGFVPDDAYLSWTFSYQPEWSAEAEKEEVTLVRVFCGAGAYNIQHAWYWVRSYDGLTPLAFAVPSFDVVYENDEIDAALESLTVTGLGSALTLTNSDFDPDTLTITSNSFWRGIGDASSSGTWVFDDGAFVLKRYEIDASYDGEINPEVVIDYSE